MQSFMPVLYRLRPALLLLLSVALLGLAGCRAGDEYTSEGSSSSPVALTIPTVSRQSTVGGSSSSYYAASTMTEGSTYSVTASQLTADADLFLYSDSGFSQSICGSAANSSGGLSCTYTPTSGSGVTTLYIQIQGISTTGSSFLLTVQ